LIGRSIQDEKELLHEMMEMLGSVSISELQNVFCNWMKKPEGVIEANGDISYSGPRPLLHRSFLF
jgi:hypothetical protein